MQLADYARAHADELCQGGAELDLREVEGFIRERVKAGGVDASQVEQEVAVVTEMLFH
jgi:hypothetical protein